MVAGLDWIHARTLSYLQHSTASHFKSSVYNLQIETSCKLLSEMLWAEVRQWHVNN